MQEYEVAFEVAAHPHRVWRLLHPKVAPDASVPRTFAIPGGSITILRDGDEAGEGLVRTCTFPVPRWLLSGGVARSWEVVTEARLDELSRYEAVGKPLWSEAEGWHTLEPIADGAGTRLTFVERYHAHNPVLRALFEARVHHFLCRDNTALYESLLGHLGPVTRVD
jgi:hypothetical protein